LVVLLFLLLTGTGPPFQVECPSSVQPGEMFSLRITSSEPGCSGISIVRTPTSSGIVFQGSSTSTSISSVSTPNGRQLSQVVVYEMIFAAAGTGDQTLGPFDVNLLGIGSYPLDQITVNISGTGRSPAGISAVLPPEQTEEVWLEGILRDTGGRIYPGTRLFLDYYVYAIVNVDNVTYWWEAPELGVIMNVDQEPDSNWEGLGKHSNAKRSLLATVEMAPAATGSLLAPLFLADITGTGFNGWGKIPSWTIESSPIILPVYPFPDNPPPLWDGTLLDSVAVDVMQLPSPPGQGGEVAVRITCVGPGIVYMQEPPVLTINGNSCLIPADNGSAGYKKWWDFVLEPEETGCHVLGPDSLVWLDRRNGTYKTVVIEPCSLQVGVIPRENRIIELESNQSGASPLLWISIGLSAVLVLTVMLGIAAKKRDGRLASVNGASDLDELLSGLENELSRLLTGRKKYLGFDELDDFLNSCGTDSFLARRILQFWKDLEQSVSEKEIKDEAFNKLKATALELLSELRRDLNSNNKKDSQ
jgi:hypothetical protein